MDQTLQATLNSCAQTPQVFSNTTFVPKADAGGQEGEFKPDGRFIFVNKSGDSEVLGNAVRFNKDGTLTFGYFNDKQTTFTPAYTCDKAGCRK